MRLIAIASLLLFASLSPLSAQGLSQAYNRGATKLEDLTPPSPEASSAVKYADIPFTHSLGMAELDVPLYTLQGVELTIPLSLHYLSSGIKLDEVAGVAGLGWTLEGGGCVTRTVVDMPDEFSVAGFSHQMPSGSLLTALENQTNNTAALNYLLDVSRHRKDSSLDRFSYSVCGLGGSFLIKDNDTVFHLSGDGVQVTFVRNSAGKIDSFTLTGPDGTVYLLSEKETANHVGLINPASPTSGENDVWTATTAWYLKRVTSASGLESAIYSYGSGGEWVCDICPTTQWVTYTRNSPQESYTTGQSLGSIRHRYQTKVLTGVSLSGFAATFSYEGNTGNNSHQTVSSRDQYANYPERLTGLDIRYDGSLLEHVDIGTGRDSQDGRIVLNSLRYYRGGELDDKWDFTYAHPIPPTSFMINVSRYSQDWYGYYNGENEILPHLVPGSSFAYTRWSVCPYEVENYASPIFTLKYGEPDGTYAHYMSLETADHDGALTEWEYEGASLWCLIL